MKKQLLVSLICIVACCSSAFAAIVGASSVCVGGTAFVHSTVDTSSSAIAWSSSNLAVATVTAGSLGNATVYGVSAGTAIITFTGPSGMSTTVFTVNPAPGAIVGGGVSICTGASITLSNPTSGGTWSSTPTSVGTVGIATGVFTGVNHGTATVMYYISTGCSVSTTVTVNGGVYSDSSMLTTTGAATVCVGGTLVITPTVAGSTWSSSNTAVATVSGGTVTGVAAGTATISFAMTASCPSVATRNVTVTASTITPMIAGGTTPIAIGSTATLTGSPSGGTWVSATPAVGTISTTGVVTGISGGTTTISYTASGCGGPVTATKVVTVNANCIAGDVLFSGATSTTSAVKVWLIKYNPSTLMLTAIDSQIASIFGTTAHYAFCGMGTDSFRVKAAFSDTLVLSSTTGYQPTYHTASAFWHSASVINHTSGIMDAGKNINMNYGTITSGPGFVAGNVTTGANKGTADGDPVPGLLVFCVNNATGAVVQQTYTDAAGHYSFSNLPTGVAYKIYPELINYATTPYPFTLTSSATSISGAHFVQHTLSKTITPNVVAVTDVADADAMVNIFPNPAKTTFNIEWNMPQAAGNAAVTITDVTGRTVQATNIDMTTANGIAPVSIGGLAKGMYIVNIKASGLSANRKIEIL